MTYCFSTPMDKLPSGMIHRTFFSQLAGHEVGCVVYLPAEYENSTKAYPVFYHLHGWQNNENTELAAMESVCRGREAITSLSFIVSVTVTTVPAAFSEAASVAFLSFAIFASKAALYPSI